MSYKPIICCSFSPRSSPFVSRIISLTACRRLQSTSATPRRVLPPVRRLSRPPRMSFSNTETPADKPADPYTATNKTEPELKEKVDDLVNFISACKFGMMTTRIESSGLLTSRCMALAAKEGGGVDLLFHTNTESGKTDDLKSDPKINIAFLNPTGEWASISGEADIVTDREMVRKYYSPALKAWLGDLEDGKHDGGPEDPRIGVIKVTAKTATYALATRTMLGRATEIAKGIVTGSSPNVNKLRELTEEELGQWRQQNS